MKMIDIEKVFNSSDLSIVNKINKIRNSLSEVSLFAIGGLPIREINKEFFLLDKKIDENNLNVIIQESLGISGMLTYANKSNLSLYEMGGKCKELKHLWGYNFITISFLFNTNIKEIEMSFLRDKRFYASWIVGYDGLFAMTGTIKDFKKYIENWEDKSFDTNTRNFLYHIKQNYEFLWL